MDLYCGIKYNKVYLKIPKIRIKLISKFIIKWKRNGGGHS